MSHDEPRDFKAIPSLSDKSERFREWPSLHIGIELAPWFWRVSYYSAPTDGHFLLLQIGPLVLHLWA